MHVAARYPWLRVVFGITLISGVVMTAYPFAPAIGYALRSPQVLIEQPTTLTEAERIAHLPDVGSTENRIVIPSIGVAMPIVEGTTESALNKGAWHLPTSAATPSSGNFVVSAHRFRYRPPSTQTFYLLDKLHVGDSFFVVYAGMTYHYHVTSATVVEPSDVSVLDPTTTPTITLITCTPLFSTTHRLIVRAQLVS